MVIEQATTSYDAQPKQTWADLPNSFGTLWLNEGYLAMEGITPEQRDSYWQAMVTFNRLLNANILEADNIANNQHMAGQESGPTTISGRDHLVSLQTLEQLQTEDPDTYTRYLEAKLVYQRYLEWHKKTILGAA